MAKKKQSRTRGGRVINPGALRQSSRVPSYLQEYHNIAREIDFIQAFIHKGMRALHSDVYLAFEIAEVANRRLNMVWERVKAMSNTVMSRMSVEAYEVLLSKMDVVDKAYVTLIDMLPYSDSD